MATVAVRHQVENYERWRAVYEEHAAARKSHGCTGDTVLRDETDPTSIMVITQWPSLENAHAFASDPSLADAMKRGGVAGTPRIEFYGEAPI